MIKLSEAIEFQSKPIKLEIAKKLMSINELYSSSKWTPEAVGRLVEGIADRWGRDRLELVMDALNDIETGNFEREQMGHMLPGEIYQILQKRISGKVFRWD